MKYIAPDSDSMDGKNFHTIFSVQKNPYSDKYVARFNPDTKTDMGSVAESLYFKSRDVLKHFLNHRILPSMEPEMCGELTGRLFDVCLHDMVGQDEVDYTVLGFSALKSDTQNILVPDLYAMQDYMGALKESDPFTFEKKLDEFFFIGNYTGDGRPLVNKRAKFCRWALDKPWCHAYLSEIHQVPEQVMADADPAYRSYMHKYLPRKYQKMYRHLVSIDGNTAAWDRPIWVMGSNSVLWKQESDHVCWWSDMCKEGVHYMGFKNPEDIEAKWRGRQDYSEITRAANEFVKDLDHVKRWTEVFSNIT